MIDVPDLGEADQSESFTLAQPDRRVVTQSYDLSITTLTEQWADGTIIIPPLQREYVWDNGKASRLIESLLLNIPIPVLYMAERPDARWEVIDGHQRIASIARYLSNEFQLSGLRTRDEFKGNRFHQLPANDQRFLKTRAIRAILITIESSPYMKTEIFERLNTGSIALNAQEIRNALTWAHGAIAYGPGATKFCD